MNLVEELKWRGLIHNITPGTEAQFLKEPTTVYIGFDPTSDSLHVGSLVPIILLMHVRKAGHKPIALLGGATGMIGDPSEKSDERPLLTEEELHKNVKGIQKVLSKFLDFDAKDSQSPLLLNNYEWMKNYSFIDFSRDVGKCITVNYMMAKDSVKKRISEEGGGGMSFTEFTYQLLQGYDFYYLHKNYNCLVQMGGSDQWGNITTGTELIRKMNEHKTEAFALTCPLVTKADGSKFSKSESGNVWLDDMRTSPYKFYQFWMNTSDEDAYTFIKIFTFYTREEIEKLIEKHKEAPHLRSLQKTLAESVTKMVHGEEQLKQAVIASSILFGKPNVEQLNILSEKDMLEIFEGVPTYSMEIKELNEPLNIVDFLVEKTGILKSNGEARRALKENSVSINKEKVSIDRMLSQKDVLANGYILAQRGKKNYFLVKTI